MTRAMRRVVARWMILVMVLTQVAMSAYACPTSVQAARGAAVAGASSSTAMADDMAMPAAKHVSAASSDHVSTANCDDMQNGLDPSAPNLCHATCHHDQQPHDAAGAATPAVILNSLYAVPAAVSVPVPARFDAQSSSDLAAAAPAYTVLHCCWRI